MTNHNVRFWRRIYSAIFMISGPVLVIASMFVLNQIISRTNQDPNSKASSFSIEPMPKMELKPERKPEPRPRSRTIDQNLAPDLSTLIAGQSFGLDHLEWLDRDSMAENMLEDMVNSIATVDAVEQAPVLTHAPPVHYPPQARQRGIAGHVLVNMLITQSGQVERWQVLESLPQGVFDEAALTAIRQWRFQPAYNQGHAVPVWVEQKITFTLN